MKILQIAMIFTWLVGALQAHAEDEDQVVVSRYKLSAMTGMMHRAIAEYKSVPDPRGKQCVLLSVGREFSGQFLFFARRVGLKHLEIICFAPGIDGGKEWSGRFVEFEGKAKGQFEEIHRLLGRLTRHPKEAEDYLPVHGEAGVEIRVGEGDEIKWAQPRGGFIAKQPKLKEDLLHCITIASSMAQLPLSKDLE